MKLASALVGLAALGGVALSSAAASAMPVGIPAHAARASNVQQAAYVCNAWGHCWYQPTYAYGYGYGNGYYHPHYYGGWGWHHRWGYWHRWHHWHNYYSGW